MNPVAKIKPTTAAILFVVRPLRRRFASRRSYGSSAATTSTAASLCPRAIVAGEVGDSVRTLVGLTTDSITTKGGMVESAAATAPRGRATARYTTTPISVAQVAPREKVMNSVVASS